MVPVVVPASENNVDRLNTTTVSIDPTVVEVVGENTVKALDTVTSKLV